MPKSYKLSSVISDFFNAIGLRLSPKPSHMATSNQTDSFEGDLKAWHDDNRKSLLEVIKESRKALDQAILTLSSAGLALGISISQFAGVETASINYLGVSWLAFGVSIVSTLSSHAISECNAERVLEELTSDYMQTAKANNIALDLVLEQKRWKLFTIARNCVTKVFSVNILEMINVLTLVGFVVGLLMLSMFAWDNVIARSKKTPQTKLSIPLSKPLERVPTMTEEKKPMHEVIKPVPQDGRRDEGLKPTTISPKPTPKPADTTTTTKVK